MASFLALRPEFDLQERLDDRGRTVSWPDLMRDLCQVLSVIIDLNGKRYQLRTQLVGPADHAFRDAAVRPPVPVTERGPSSQVLELTQLILM